MSEYALPAHELSSEELVRTETGLTVTVGTKVPEADHEPLWEIVQQGFIDLNRRSYEKQDMSHEEFVADLMSPNVYKYVARDAAEKPVGVLTVHIGFDDITWTDTSDLQSEQDKADPSAPPYYVGTLVIPPGLRGSETAPYLVKASFIHFKKVNSATQKNSLVFFDCAHANYPWLGEFVQRIGSPNREYPGIKTDVKELYQEYWLDPGDGADVFQSREQRQGVTTLDSQHHYSITIEAN